VNIQRLFERLRLHHVGIKTRAAPERIDSGSQGLLIGVNEQFKPKLFDAAVAKGDHFTKFPRRVDVQ